MLLKRGYQKYSGDKGFMNLFKNIVSNEKQPPNFKGFLKHFRIGILIVVLFLIFGCGKSYRLYNGPSLPQNEVAILFCPSGTNVKLFEVNGKKGPNEAGLRFPGKSAYGSDLDNSFRIELLPGKHTLAVGYYQQTPGGIRYSKEDYILEFEAGAGRLYTIEIETFDNVDRWKAKVVEVKR